MKEQAIQTDADVEGDALGTSRKAYLADMTDAQWMISNGPAPGPETLVGTFHYCRHSNVENSISPEA